MGPRVSASGKAVQWGHMSKQLAHRCIEFMPICQRETRDTSTSKENRGLASPALSMNFRRRDATAGDESSNRAAIKDVVFAFDECSFYQH